MNRLIMSIMLVLVVPAIQYAQINWTEHPIAGNFSYCSVFAIDMDNDGDVDVLGSDGNAGITWWENDGEENFTKHNIEDHFYVNFVYAIDMDNDGDMDVLGAGCEWICIAWWENDGDENFIFHSIWYEGYIMNCYAYPIDMDNDGDVDVLGTYVWGMGLPESYWWENNGENPPTFYAHELSDRFASFIYGIDLDSDGDTDILEATGWESSGWDIYWRKNNGDEVFTGYGIDSTFASGAKSVYAIDMDNDGDVDVLGSGWHGGGTDIVLYENDGSENFSEHSLADDFNGANSVYAIDMDNDGDIDVLGAAIDIDEIAWWENDGENFTKYTIAGNFDGAHSIYAIDMDNDGDMDVLGASSLSRELTWWESDLIVLDVGTISIDIPSTLPEDIILNPQATVTNLGTDTVTFDVTCTIEPGAYTSTETAIYLASGDSTQVIFSPDFAFISGIYTVKVYTQLADDGNPENDTLEKIIETYDPGIAEEDLDMFVSFSFGLRNNPAKGKALFNLALPKTSQVNLTIYDISGRIVDKVISGIKQAGNYQVSWDSKTTVSGIYFYRFESSYKNAVGKLILIH